ncbi:LytTR family DNA-binding domain-containing protein [Salinimicrobium sp. TIG7-5_MAKvit]|uniref:LytR/AlgR family response regulator transcription factor n=1 Tax=Salinimicrobium sp. TIG7-5_MAKvit TaxID=3121289 RepID=UPI003C6E1420
MDIVIIEDEDLAAESLIGLLLKIRPDLVIKKRLESVKQAIEWFSKNTCELIFSDIHLGDGESFEIFEALKIDTPIIFTTAFDHYAIQSFQYYAVDYLLKPYDKAKLTTAIEKYMSYTNSSFKRSQDLEKLIIRLKASPEVNPNKTRFLVSRGEEFISISSEEIAYFMAENKTLFLFTRAGEIYLYEDTISNLDEKLSEKDFFKINRKFIVRHNAIQSIIRYSQNRLKVNLQPSPGNNEPVLISSKNVQVFKEWLNH